MTRKALPKAIVPNRGDLLEPTTRAIIIDEAAAEPRAAPRANGAGMDAVPLMSSPPLDSRPLPASSAAGPQLTRGRRGKAQKIVARYRLYAALGGLTPVPVVNIAGVTAIILRMVKVLSRLYDVPFERDLTRAMVVGLMGGAVPTGLAAATASTLVFVTPASALVGLAVSSVSAAAFTYGIGQVFIDHFENTTPAAAGLPAHAG
jgi:uncharacterized protein (DUF697 family)